MKQNSLRYNTQFLLVWLGQTTSIFGDRVTGIALPWLLLQQTHSAFDAGIIIAMRYIPLVLFGLVAGLVVDRLDRRIVLIYCDIGRAAILGLIVYMGIFRLAPPLWALASVVLVLGTGQLFFLAAYRAWLPDITHEEHLSNATAALEASDATSTLLGPLLGGIIIQSFGAALALGADAFSYIISALMFLCVRDSTRVVTEVKERPERQSSFSRVWREAGEGIRFILSTPAQRVLKGISTVLYMSSGSIELLLTTLTQVILHLPAWQAGLVFGAAGVGGLVGSVLAPRFYKRGWRKSITWALLLGAVSALGLACTGLFPPSEGFLLALVSNLTLDGVVSFSFILTTTENVLITPREIRGRVNAASNMYASMSRGIAVLVAGIIATSNAPAFAFALLACCFLGAAFLARGRSISTNNK